jgi:hypothetical protein
MKTVIEYDELHVPDWALSYLVNGDASGLSVREQAQVDVWFRKFVLEATEQGAHAVFCVGEGEAYFRHIPAFGLACDVIDCSVKIMKEGGAL